MGEKTNSELNQIIENLEKELSKSLETESHLRTLTSCVGYLEAEEAETPETVNGSPGSKSENHIQKLNDLVSNIRRFNGRLLYVQKNLSRLVG